MLINRLIAVILSLLLNLNITYSHINKAPSGFYTVYDLQGECIDDDIQLINIIDDYILK